ncbi:hypothetical protein TRFO_16580 [Tritrichomonas foetus]|uniref:Uncharacterized protein n=1 Tax=Tritrichomonas foetus TaxID=1144522 RepID=A0A1J4KQ80_9EUKA|nr:hypothetical protein TRFO_16580 [Tritrichomonas foetus]|eukprot:OHT13266.1 hypothetical protein TRFO_16580 [Tritrichomonas foetus]
MPQYPYPPPGYPPYPYPPYGYPPQQNSNNQPNNQQQQNMPPPYQYPPQAYPPYPYPPSYGYPPQQQQQPVQQQQQPQNNERMMFDWERAKLPGQGFQNNSPSHPMNQQQPNMNQPPPAKQSAFDWENGGAAQPQKPIEIDWNYKSEYDVPDVPPDVTRDPSVTAICTSRAFDPSTLPKLDDSFFKLFPSDAAAELRAQKMRSTFQKRGNSKSRETFRIKFQFDDDNISDLSVSATFHVNELTYKLYDFLSEVVFMEGTKFLLRNTFPAKVIASAHNQRLKDVKVTGNCILIVKISHFTGLKDDVNTQYSMQKAAIAEQIQKLEAEKQQPQSE